MEKKPNEAWLLLEDGTEFRGFSSDRPLAAEGEAVLNNSIVGYQEILTDPANAGKIVIFTYPSVGNYGAAEKFNESPDCHAQAAVVKSLSPFCSNWQSEETLGDFFNRKGKVCLEGVDTRMLARALREKGEIKAVIQDTKSAPSGAFKPQKPAPYIFRKENPFAPAEVNKSGSRPAARIGVLDLGVTDSLLSQLAQSGVETVLIPFDASEREITSLSLNGLIISSGPEEENLISAAAETAGKLRGRLPVLGIAAGCAAIGLSLGGSVKKLHSGHRGMNYPVKPADSFKGRITYQNHRLILDKNSVMKKTKPALFNLNDGTVEAIESSDYKMTGIQYYPLPGGPGVIDGSLLKFIEQSKENGA